MTNRPLLYHPARLDNPVPTIPFGVPSYSTRCQTYLEEIRMVDLEELTLNTTPTGADFQMRLQSESSFQYI